ncbi:MAG: GatB/YqeY domain-containing protein [Candidatus Hydrogenedentes bacterium]|nr:GatB/YqeY domain-containing protein [Candidatus Hydrogenedentota bacterium]
MSIRERVQDDMKSAMKAGEKDRLECLRMVKAALLLKEKETGQDISEEVAVATLRGEIRKRQQSLELFKELGKADEAAKTEAEIQVIDGYLPKQLSADETEARVRAYLAEHPELNHPGKLTGAMKKELGDLVDGKTLNEVCKKVLG